MLIATQHVGIRKPTVRANHLRPDIRPRIGRPLATDQAKIFPGNSRTGERGDFGDVIGRRYLDQVHANETLAMELAQNRLRLPTGETADFRRAGARYESRVGRRYRS